MSAWQRLLVGALVVVLSGCADGAPPASTAGGSDATQSSEVAVDPPVVDLEGAIGALAASGIGVYEEPDSAAPLEAVAEPASPLRLLRFQVEALVDEAVAGAGLPVDVIDDLAPTPDDTVPLSFVVAGYAATAVTPGGKEANRLMAGQAFDRPEALLFPTLVLVLFIGETSAAAVRLSGVPPADSPPITPGLQVAAIGGIGPGSGLVAPAAAGPCGAFSTFLAGVIQGVQDAILSLIPNVPFLKAAIEWALKEGLGLAGDALKLIEDHIPFLKAIKQGVALLALGITAATSIRSWAVATTVDPSRAHYNVGATITEVTMRATVDDGGGDFIPESVRECLALIRVEDQVRGGAKGSAVEWHFVEGVEHTFTSEALEKALGDDKHATFRFTMADEPALNHERPGPLVNNPIRVRLTIHRQDVAALKRYVDGFSKQLVGDVLFSALTKHLGDPLGRLAKLLDITADRLVIAEHHLEPEPTPSPEATPSPSPTPTPDPKAEFCTRYRALLRWWLMDPTTQIGSKSWAAEMVRRFQEMQGFGPPDVQSAVGVHIGLYTVQATMSGPEAAVNSVPWAEQMPTAVETLDQYCAIQPGEYNRPIGPTPIPTF